MSHFPQQQYSSLHASGDRRLHLNLLMHDQLDNIEVIHGTGQRLSLSLVGAKSPKARAMSRATATPTVPRVSHAPLTLLLTVRAFLLHLPGPLTPCRAPARACRWCPQAWGWTR